ncbi:MAG TPA: lysylphosphatidylglycerol synthase transmembrane domain-containing protein [Methylomirabilota bacterium]
MRAVKAVLLVLGITLLGVLVYRIGAGPILETLGRLTWWQFALVCLPYAVITAADTLGWRFAFARDQAPFWRLYGARLAGEALNLVTAVGAVGGEAVKAWLVRRDVTYAESVPSVIIAKTTITLSQAVFLLIGVALAWLTLPVGTDVVPGMLGLLAVEVLALAGFVGVQVSGLVARGGRLLRMFGALESTGYAESLDRALRHYYRTEWRRFGLSFGFHLVGWLLSALDALVILWALGVSPSVTTATIVESLGSGVRFATFLVPASLGPLEAANAAAFAALGLGAEVGLAFSLIRRARQAVWIAIGVAVLVLMRRSAGRAPVATDSARGD